MTDPVAGYFGAERAASILFIVIALVAVEVAVTLWRRAGSPAAKGAAVTLMLVAAIQSTVGAVLFVRSPQDQARVAQALANARTQIGEIEIPRMQQVMSAFTIYRRIEIALLALGTLMALVGRRRGWARGAGLALALQAALMLVFDGLAERRGRAYLDWLLTL